MIKKTNKNYWNKFYIKKLALNQPSNFAKFVVRYIKQYKSKIIDIGCGNGRDIFFFRKKKLNFLGIDLSNNATSLIKNKLIEEDKKKILNADFVKFDYKKKIKGKFSIYSRFTWHSINEKNENILLKKISKLSNLEYIFIEARSVKDDLFGVGKKLGKNEYVTDHYRRFIDKNDLIKKFNNDFKIIYLKESKGFSKFKKENPCLIRLIAIKKSIKT